MVDSMMLFCKAADISIYVLVSDFLRVQFHCHLCVGCPGPLRMDATLLCIGVPHEHRPDAMMASFHVLILTRFFCLIITRMLTT